MSKPKEDFFEEEFSKDHFIEVLEALHIDQTGLAQAMYEIEASIQRWTWATESRGCYEWDDDEFYKEFANCLGILSEQVATALRKTNKAHQLCCNKYRHVHRLDPEPVQMELDLGVEYSTFVEGLLNLTTIEGTP